MAFPASGLFVPTQVTGGVGTIVVNYDLETHRVALYTNSVASPDLTVDTAYGVAPWNANEVVGTGYTAGGNLLVSTTYAHTSGGVVMWDAADPSWSTATITARGALYYADALAGNQGILAQTFGADIVSTAGTFLITLAAGGLFSVDWVP